MLAATLPTASFLRFAFCQGTPGIPDFREVLQHFPLQWAAYFGRAVAKLDHSCVAPLSPSQFFLSCIANKIFIVCNHSAAPAKSYSLLSLMHSTPPRCSTFRRKLHRLASYRWCSLGLSHDALPATLTCVRRRYWPPRSFPHRNFLVRDILCRGVV